MFKLAIDGGERIFKETPALPIYPSAYPETAKLLGDIYLNTRKWSYYGPYEKQFVANFAKYHDSSYGVFMANGTVTLECALAALGVGPGDEVIVPAYTWMATAMAVLYVGATPIFVDNQADTLCMDPIAFEAAITPLTKAVIPVHLFGSIADLDEICRIAGRHDIKVIEDCAHAHGGKWDGKGVGSFGAVGSFSFQQSKIMTAGEGGLCTTSNPELYDKLCRLKHIGNGPDAIHGKPGTPPPLGLYCHNYRATEFQAVILQSQLEHLAEQTRIREKGAAYLKQRFELIPGLKVQARGHKATTQNYYVYAVMVDPAVLKPGITRDHIIAALQAEGVPEVFPGWCEPVYKHKLWNVETSKYRIASCEVAEDIIYNRVILFALMWLMAPRADQEKLCSALEKVMKEYLK
ncbi:MAG: DegT/DnrJ/EryC1/StrS family aminotransferase [Victivallales bacterium]